MAVQEETVVVFPGMGVGHLKPLLELSKRIISDGLSVDIALINSPSDSSLTATVTDQINAAAYPSITFHHLPPVALSPDMPVILSRFEMRRQSNPHLLSFVKSLSPQRNVQAMVLDFFCTDALDVANELGIPAYFFFASGAFALSVFVSLSTMNLAPAKIQELGDTRVNFPGLIPVPANHISPSIFESEEINREFLYHFGRLPNAKGIAVNTFKWLDVRAIKALSSGTNFSGRPMPPIYCVGPIVSRPEDVAGERNHECLRWLDNQPHGSVVFLCFGSAGRFSKEQIREIGNGLERSGQRFLWVLKSPKNEDPSKLFENMPDPDLDTLLPEGFMKRTKDRGLVVKSWAPQTAVLGHVATGGFVTHCGWNSVLESIIAGVPMIAWPMYAEQRLNKVFLVEDVKLAAEMKGYDKELVSADEVELKLKWLMESDEGQELKKRAAAAKEAAAAAVREGGSSYVELTEFIKACKGDKK